MSFDDDSRNFLSNSIANLHFLEDDDDDNDQDGLAEADQTEEKNGKRFSSEKSTSNDYDWLRTTASLPSSNQPDLGKIGREKQKEDKLIDHKEDQEGDSIESVEFEIENEIEEVSEDDVEEIVEEIIETTNNSNKEDDDEYEGESIASLKEGNLIAKDTSNPETEIDGVKASDSTDPSSRMSQMGPISINRDKNIGKKQKENEREEKDVLKLDAEKVFEEINEQHQSLNGEIGKIVAVVQEELASAKETARQEVQTLVVDVLQDDDHYELEEFDSESNSKQSLDERVDSHQNFNDIAENMQSQITNLRNELRSELNKNNELLLQEINDGILSMNKRIDNARDEQSITIKVLSDKIDEFNLSLVEMERKSTRQNEKTIHFSNSIENSLDGLINEKLTSKIDNLNQSFEQKFSKISKNLDDFVNGSLGKMAQQIEVKLQSKYEQIIRRELSSAIQSGLTKSIKQSQNESNRLFANQLKEEFHLTIEEIRSLCMKNNEMVQKLKMAIEKEKSFCLDNFQRIDKNISQLKERNEWNNNNGNSNDNSSVTLLTEQQILDMIEKSLNNMRLKEIDEKIESLMQHINPKMIEPKATIQSNQQLLNDFKRISTNENNNNDKSEDSVSINYTGKTSVFDHQGTNNDNDNDNDNKGHHLSNNSNNMAHSHLLQQSNEYNLKRKIPKLQQHRKRVEMKRFNDGKRINGKKTRHVRFKPDRLDLGAQSDSGYDRSSPASTNHLDDKQLWSKSTTDLKYVDYQPIMKNHHHRPYLTEINNKHGNISMAKVDRRRRMATNQSNSLIEIIKHTTDQLRKELNNLDMISIEGNYQTVITRGSLNDDHLDDGNDGRWLRELVNRPNLSSNANNMIGNNLVSSMNNDNRLSLFCDINNSINSHQNEDQLLMLHLRSIRDSVNDRLMKISSSIQQQKITQI